MMTAAAKTTTMGAMTATTDPRPARRTGLSVRARITATAAVLVTVALAGAGLIVYVVESGRIEASVQREVEQELNEFAKLERDGIDPRTGADFATVERLLHTFLRRNVPDDDELLVAWVDGAPWRQFPGPDEDPLPADPRFVAAAEPLVTTGGTTRIDTDRGEVRITSQPVEQGDATGALLVVAYLDEDRAELRDTMRTYAIVAALSMLIIAWVAWWQAGRLLAPLRTLGRTADEIGASDLSRRIPETGNDDLTALTRTVNGMLDRLEAAFTTQRQFLDDAGHELRTPLTVLRGHLELMDPADPLETAETRDLLLDETDRMARLVGDLILLAKIGRPDFVAPSEVDPVDLAAAVLTKARALGDRHWILDTAPTAERGLFVLDEQRITQALLQYADNAVKHTGPGDEIGIGCLTTGDRVRWWVRDTGPGVAPEHRSRVFERFQRADVHAGDEGFGLGLSIVSAIAAAHGGTAYVTDPPSDRPSGALFVLDVPAVRRYSADGPDRTGPTEPADPERTQEVPWPGS